MWLTNVNRSPQSEKATQLPIVSLTILFTGVLSCHVRSPTILGNHAREPFWPTDLVSPDSHHSD